MAICAIFASCNATRKVNTAKTTTDSTTSKHYDSARVVTHATEEQQYTQETKEEGITVEFDKDTAVRTEPVTIIPHEDGSVTIKTGGRPIKKATAGRKTTAATATAKTEDKRDSAAVQKRDTASFQQQTQVRNVDVKRRGGWIIWLFIGGAVVGVFLAYKKRTRLFGIK